MITLFSLLLLSNFDELVTYGVSSFGGSACLASDDTHPVHTDTAKKFRDPFYDQGAWDSIRWRENAQVRGSLWQDGVSDTDTWGIDSADVIYIHTHGSHKADRSTIWMGTDSEVCDIDTHNDIRLGNGDLDIAVIKACQSADYFVWQNGSYDEMIIGNQFRMWNGFHGDSACGAFVKWYVKDYAKHSFSNGVGENWLDEAYRNRIGDDDCPVSIVWGATGALRDSMFENGGWLDRKDTGAKNNSTIYYMAGCNPDNGERLPE